MGVIRLHNKRLAAALAIAVAVTGSSTGFVSPAANHVMAPAAGTT